MQTEKLMFIAPHPQYPNLFARVTKLWCASYYGVKIP